MAVEVDIDVEVLKCEIKKTYARVSQKPEEDFIFPRLARPGFVTSAIRLERHGFERIETGDLVETCANSAFEDTRRKAEKYGARGTTVKAFRRGR
jgi:hypothetical protein